RSNGHAELPVCSDGNDGTEEARRLGRCSPGAITGNLSLSSSLTGQPPPFPIGVLLALHEGMYLGGADVLLNGVDGGVVLAGLSTHGVNRAVDGLHVAAGGLRVRCGYEDHDDQDAGNNQRGKNNVWQNRNLAARLMMRGDVGWGLVARCRLP